MNEQSNRDIYFAKNLEKVGAFNHFIISLLIYDRVCLDYFTFITQVLPNTPKKYHQLLLDLPELELIAYYVDESFIFSEMKPYFRYDRFDYTNLEFDIFAKKLISKIHIYTRVTDEKLILKLISNQVTSGFIDLHDAIRVLNCNFFNASAPQLQTLEKIDHLQVYFDKGQSTKIFEINRLPDLKEHYQNGDFNIEKFLQLRDKSGLSVLRELIFKEKNFENTDELIREYNDMLLKTGVHKSIFEKPLWAISNALSILGLLSQDIVTSMVVTSASLVTGNFKTIIHDQPDKLRNFIKNDLRPIVENIEK
ncbi:hypothetical protein [Paenibacillus endoradicis]|uniref:hypothetical protein n=1 Tax=Paenibacillus endoradicis TaxID=2972487 RepID=UPI002159A152|nr:hypothetical protein [Paenibacillus endoradicis]MCR8659183.1 hypothetical protein [Paenibacillus endoradicis]